MELRARCGDLQLVERRQAEDLIGAELGQQRQLIGMEGVVAGAEQHQERGVVGQRLEALVATDDLARLYLRVVPVDGLDIVGRGHALARNREHAEADVVLREGRLQGREAKVDRIDLQRLVRPVHGLARPRDGAEIRAEAQAERMDVLRVVEEQLDRVERQQLLARRRGLETLAAHGRIDGIRRAVRAAGLRGAEIHGRQTRVQVQIGQVEARAAEPLGDVVQIDAELAVVAGRAGLLEVQRASGVRQQVGIAGRALGRAGEIHRILAHLREQQLDVGIAATEEIGRREVRADRRDRHRPPLELVEAEHGEAVGEVRAQHGQRHAPEHVAQIRARQITQVHVRRIHRVEPVQHERRRGAQAQQLVAELDAELALARQRQLRRDEGIEQLHAETDLARGRLVARRVARLEAVVVLRVVRVVLGEAVVDRIVVGDRADIDAEQGMRQLQAGRVAERGGDDIALVVVQIAVVVVDRVRARKLQESRIASGLRAVDAGRHADRIVLAEVLLPREVGLADEIVAAVLGAHGHARRQLGLQGAGQIKALERKIERARRRQGCGA